MPPALYYPYELGVVRSKAIARLIKLAFSIG